MSIRTVSFTITATNTILYSTVLSVAGGLYFVGRRTQKLQNIQKLRQSMESSDAAKKK